MRATKKDALQVAEVPCYTAQFFSTVALQVAVKIAQCDRAFSLPEAHPEGSRVCHHDSLQVLFSSDMSYCALHRWALCLAKGKPLKGGSGNYAVKAEQNRHVSCMKCLKT